MLVFKKRTKKIFELKTLILFSVFLLLIVFLQVANTQLTDKDEYNVKSKFLLSFPKFIDWPDKSDVNDLRKPFIIGVIGISPFRSYLDNNSSAIKIKNKFVKIEYYSSPNELTECNMLFISKCSEKEFKLIMNKVRKKPILVISDEQDFTCYSAMLSFYKEGVKVRFLINDEKAKESGLQISYHLLSIGSKVKPEDQQ